MPVLYVSMTSPHAQELKRHGVELSGPAAKLLRCGTDGQWGSNVERDMLNALGKGGLQTAA